MTLIDRLKTLARLWAEVQERSLPRLSTIVVNDGKFFQRLEETGYCSIAKFEQFLVFFREPANWPEATLPADAAELLDEISMIATGPEPIVGTEANVASLLSAGHDAPPVSGQEWPIEAEASAGKSEEISGTEAVAA